MANEPQLTPEMQQQLQTLQTMSQQLQQITSQRQQFELMDSENSRALAAMEGLPEDGKAYRQVGGLLIPVRVGDARTKITDDRETMELRIKRAKSQEEEMQKRFLALQADLQKKLQAPK